MKIEITSGTYGYRPKGTLHPMPIERGGTCEVSEEEAQRLFRLGVARSVQESEEMSIAPSESENGVEDEESARLNAEQLKTMTNTNLCRMAEEMGIDTTKLKTKAQLIAAINNIPLEDAISEEGEQPPALGVEEPVV